MNAKDIVSKEFDTVKRGGYDAAEVDTFFKGCFYRIQEDAE